MKYSIILLCLNEAANIGHCIRETMNFLKSHALDAEIIVADNGSTDASRAIAAQHRVRIIITREKGYGRSIRNAVQQCHSEYVILLDGDSTYSSEEIPRFIRELEKGCDMVIGNRFSGRLHRKAMPILHRYLGNPFLSSLARKLFHCPISDFHCGFRAFKRDVFLSLNLRATGMELATEMIIAAQLSNISITEVVVSLSPPRYPRKSHLKPMRDGCRHLIIMLRLKANSYFRNYPAAKSAKLPFYL